MTAKHTKKKHLGPVRDSPPPCALDAKSMAQLRRKAERLEVELETARVALAHGERTPKHQDEQGGPLAGRIQRYAAGWREWEKLLSARASEALEKLDRAEKELRELQVQYDVALARSDKVQVENRALQAMLEAFAQNRAKQEEARADHDPKFKLVLRMLRANRRHVAAPSTEEIAAHAKALGISDVFTIAALVEYLQEYNLTPDFHLAARKAGDRR